MPNDLTKVAYPLPAAPLLYEPPAEYHELRDRSSVCRVAYRGSGDEAWLAVGYDAVRAVLTDPVFSRAAAVRNTVPRVGVGRLGFAALLGSDPPEHTRLRHAVARTFATHRVAPMRAGIRALAEELAQRTFRLPAPVDLMAAFSYPLAFAVIREKMGIPVGDEEFLRDVSGVLASRSSRDRDEVDRAFADLLGYLRELVEVKRAAPADDLMTALVAVLDVDGGLSLDEVIEMAALVLVVGHETSASMIALFVLTLLEHPAELARLRADPALVPGAVEELLRFIPVSDGASALVRVALDDTVLGDQLIAAGDAVIPAVAAANRDPEQFPDPDSLDLGRTGSKGLMFGGGHHYCLGAALARIELQEALAALLRHLPDGVRVAVEHHELQCDPSASVRRLRAFPLTW